MNNDKLYIQANGIVSKHRQRAVSIATDNLLKANKHMPLLATLEAARLNAGVEAARLSAAGADKIDIASSLNNIKELDIQIDKLLCENGLDKNDLVPNFYCKSCNDTGRKNGAVCQCVHNAAQELRREELKSVSPLSLCSFDTFSLSKYPSEIIQNGTSARAQMQGIFDFCKDYAEDFSKKSQSLYLCGSSGLGKTHLALSIANVALYKGFNVLYVSSQGAFDTIEHEHFGGAGNTLYSLMDADLLILDDLGTEYLTPFIGSSLYDLINTRWNRHLPTVYTSNFMRTEELSKRYTEKIVSRLLGECQTLHFIGNDIRLQEK